MSYRLLYFASLADRAGCSGETIDSIAPDPAALYDEVAARHGFVLARARVRVAINGRFADWRQSLEPGDEVVFLPPVSGG